MIFLSCPVLSLQMIFRTMIGSFLNVFVGRLAKKTVSRLVFLPPPGWGDSAPLLLPYPFIDEFDSEKHYGARWHLCPGTAESSIPIGLYPSDKLDRPDECGHRT